MGTTEAGQAWFSRAGNDLIGTKKKRCTHYSIEAVTEPTIRPAGLAHPFALEKALGQDHVFDKDQRRNAQKHPAKDQLDKAGFHSARHHA